MASFRLLQLPQFARTEVLRSAGSLELITLSFLSKKAKKLVESLNLETCESIQIAIESVIRVTLFTETKIVLKFYKYHTEEENRDLAQPGVVNVMIGDNHEHLYDYKIPHYSMRNWLNHILVVTNLQEILKAHIREGMRFDYDSLFETINLNIKSLYFETPECLKYASRYPMLGIGPKVDTISVKHKLLIQNFDILHIPIAELTLNDLLMCNCISLQAYRSQFSSKDLNRFIKWWKSGKLIEKKRMKKLIIEDPDLIKEVVLDGIDHQDIHENVRKNLEKRNQILFGPIEGARDIVNVLGKRATVLIHPAVTFFEMIFWP